MTTKPCAKCNKVLPISEFRLRKNKAGVKVPRSYCFPCERKKNKEYYNQNKEGFLALAKEYYKVNKKKVLKYRKKYLEENRESINKKGREYYRRKLKLRMLGGAKRRAKLKNIPFDITENDFEIPEFCPLLPHVRLTIGSGVLRRDSPSLDRIDPTLGYTKGNVMVISYRANTMKSDAKPEEVFLLAKNLKKIIKDFSK